uniref:Uncharacterized protein n=1 Tax=Anguilla anguilla TaxID=7936 RepID=A0A0E9QEN1_ANGAN
MHRLRVKSSAFWDEVLSLGSGGCYSTVWNTVAQSEMLVV